MLAGGALLIALGAGAYSLGLVGAARIAVRGSRDEIVVRHLLGSDATPLWAPLAAWLGGAAMTGVLASVAFALLGATWLRLVGSPSPGWLGWLLTGLFVWVAGTAGLSVAATRREVLRMARAALLVLLSLLPPLGAQATQPEWAELGRTADELHRVGRELAVARRALHRAERSITEAERLFLGAVVRGDAALEGLARARWKTEADELERWQRRCAHLRERRADLRARYRAAQLGPPIEPRVVPVRGEVAVPFDGPPPRVSAAAFRHGVGLRVGGGETIVSTAPGRVAFAGPLAGAGPVVVVDHGRRVYSVYGRIGAPLVAQGAQVASGEPVARAPERPSVVYFSVRKRGRAIDPLRWIRTAQDPEPTEG
jgi:murein DD-endopeptidase MepM/ murein hydrolase activator NlpD